MADYIDRQAVIDMFQRNAYDDWNQGVSVTWANAFSECADMVEDIPSEDVEPVRHGKWIPKFNGQFKGGAYWFDCSVCGRIVPDVRNGGWNYCPNCGARMDGEI